jgi:hypothetical protein
MTVRYLCLMHVALCDNHPKAYAGTKWNKETLCTHKFKTWFAFINYVKDKKLRSADRNFPIRNATS